MSNKDGGPAFPNTVKITDEDYAELRGMTLRDYFAAKAMQGFCVSTAEDGPVGGWDFNYLATYAYKAADAMLKAREEQ